MKKAKRKKSIHTIGGITSTQKYLTTFFEEEDKEKEEDKIEKRIGIQEEIIEDKRIEKKPLDQIETDYRERSFIETCAEKLRERFNINIEILPIRYGNRPSINQKIYGYYMLITVKGKGKDHIIEFIQKHCNLKVYM